MSSPLIDTDSCYLCMRQDFDVRPVLHTRMRWITIKIKGNDAGWHVCCGSCLFNLWCEMDKLGTLDLDDMPRGYQHNYHTEWNTRIRNKVTEDLVRRGWVENADVDEIIDIQLKRKLWPN